MRLQRERNQRFGAGQIVDILLGRSTARITQNDQASLSTFGIGTGIGIGTGTELGTMSGVGANKLAKYGEAILAVLAS